MLSFDLYYVLKVIPQLLVFLPITVLVTFSAVICGSVLGFILAIFKIKQRPFFYTIAQSYIVIIRCTPPIVLLFLVYYGLPILCIKLFNLDITDYYKGLFVIITFSLIYAANMAEIMRSAYLAIDKGQLEAAISNGLNEKQALYRIVIPQAAVIAIPNICNSLISLMKDGSLAYIIGLMDMLGAGENIIARNYGSYGLEIYVALAIIYWLLVIVIEIIFKWLEHHYMQGKYNMAII